MKILVTKTEIRHFNTVAEAFDTLCSDKWSLFTREDLLDPPSLGYEAEEAEEVLKGHAFIVSHCEHGFIPQISGTPDEAMLEILQLNYTIAPDSTLSPYEACVLVQDILGGELKSSTRSSSCYLHLPNFDVAFRTHHGHPSQPVPDYLVPCPVQEGELLSRYVEEIQALTIGVYAHEQP
jgi:hypothetical protein